LGVRGLRKKVEQKTYERTEIANLQLPNKKHHLSDKFRDPVPAMFYMVVAKPRIFL